MNRNKLLGLALACAALTVHADTEPRQHTREETLSVRGATEQPYALVRADARSTQGSGNKADWKAIDAAKRAIPGDFLWFRDDGKAYVVRDAAVLAKVIDAWAPVHRLGKDLDVYSREMDQHGKTMEALGRQMEQVRRQPEAAASVGRQMKEAGKPMDALGKKMDVLGKQVDAEARVAEKTMRALIRDALAKGLAAPAPAG